MVSSTKKISGTGNSFKYLINKTKVLTFLSAENHVKQLLKTKTIKIKSLSIQANE